MDAFRLRTTSRAAVVPVLITLGATELLTDDAVVALAAAVRAVGREHNKRAAGGVVASAFLIHHVILDGVGRVSGAVPHADGVTLVAAASVRVARGPGDADVEAGAQPLPGGGGCRPANVVRGRLGLAHGAGGCGIAVDYLLCATVSSRRFRIVLLLGGGLWAIIITHA